MHPKSLVLAFPPVFEPDFPYLSVPALAASLRGAGVPTRVRDLNVEAHAALLGAPFQEYCRSRLDERLAELDERDELSPTEAKQQATLGRLLAGARTATARVAPALAALRDPEAAFDPEVYDAAMRAVLRAFATVNAVFAPTRVSYGELDVPGMRWTAEAMMAFALDRARNPFVELYERSGLADSVAADVEDAAAFGLSVIDSEQLLPALTLVAALRRRLPHTKVVLGGPYLTKLVAELEAAPVLFDLVDAIIVGEGETPLRALHAVWTGQATLDDVPNLVRREGDRVLVHRPFGVEDLRSLPVPDFDGLPLADYWSPEPVLPLLASRGCYWGRCSFCAHSYIYRRAYATLRADDVAERMAHLSARHGARAFFFADEGLSPPFVRRLAGALRDRDLDVRWGMEARLEKGFDRETLARARDAGLGLVVFGLESYSERVLGRMAKGIDRASIGRILDDCIDLGIAVHLWLIAGFPTETLDEAMETLSFVFEHPRLTLSPDFACGLNRFALTRHCPIERAPEEYGVRPLPRTPEEAFLTVSRFEQTEGMSEDELDEVFRRFDLLERSLPPDIRRTGRVYHLLRNAAARG